MRVVFMGTPDIAATCLQKILTEGFDVVGVYTQPDRPKNRGMKLCFSGEGGRTKTQYSCVSAGNIPRG